MSSRRHDRLAANASSIAKATGDDTTALPDPHRLQPPDHAGLDVLDAAGRRLLRPPRRDDGRRSHRRRPGPRCAGRHPEGPDPNRRTRHRCRRSPAEVVARTDRLLTNLGSGLFANCRYVDPDLAHHRACPATARAALPRDGFAVTIQEPQNTRFLGPRRAQERDMLARAIGAGAVSPGLDPDTTVDALVGPLVYRALTGADIPRGLVDTLVEDLLRPRSR